GRVDWASKYWMLKEFMQAEDLTWQDPWIRSLDLEFHNLNRQTGLYWALEESGDAWRKTNDSAIEFAQSNAPKGTRADGRGELVKTLAQCQTGYLIDWIGFRLNKEEPYLMLDPFVSYKKEIRTYLERLDLQQPYDRDGFYR
ncbi:MAG: proteasome accessory factor PafA2 family protein, partial [Nitrospinaceae bacterium]